MLDGFSFFSSSLIFVSDCFVSFGWLSGLHIRFWACVISCRMLNNVNSVDVRRLRDILRQCIQCIKWKTLKDEYRTVVSWVLFDVAYECTTLSSRTIRLLNLSDYRRLFSVFCLNVCGLFYSSLYREIQLEPDLPNPLWAHWNRRATDHYTAIQWLVHWPLIWVVQRGGARTGCGPVQSPHACTN